MRRAAHYNGGRARKYLDWVSAAGADSESGPQEAGKNMKARVQYALEANADKRLELSWDGVWRDMQVVLDGQLLGTIPDQKALQAGQDFHAPDGSTLHIQLVRGFLSYSLQILRDGRPIPGTAAYPPSVLNDASVAAYMLAAWFLFPGLYALLFNVQTLLAAGIGPLQVVIGLVYLASGYFIRKGSLPALIVATVLVVLNMLYFLPAALLHPSFTGFLGLALYVYLLLRLMRGFGAIRTLRQQRA